MERGAKNLLKRWQSLEEDNGLQRARFIARTLWLVGLALCLFVLLGVVFKLPSAVVAISATVMGWRIAESNALRTRIAQWPILRRYIDWKRVREDVGSDDSKA